MKIISWNIRGCNHSRNIKILSRKIKQEKPDVLLLQETKCRYETLMRMGNKIWKGSSILAIDAEGMEGGMMILWNPGMIELSKWHANYFSLMAVFKFLGSGAT